MTDNRSQVAYGSGAWWRTRTDDELQEAIDRNPPGGRSHDGPMAELERRNAERNQRRNLFWIRLTFAAAALGIVATIAVALFSR